MSEQEFNEWQAFERLYRLPVAEVKEIAQRCHRPARNHRKRCEALARFLTHNYEKAIASDLPPDWKPSTFETFLDGWIAQIFGR